MRVRSREIYSTGVNVIDQARKRIRFKLIKDKYRPIFVKIIDLFGTRKWGLPSGLLTRNTNGGWVTVKTYLVQMRISDYPFIFVPVVFGWRSVKNGPGFLETFFSPEKGRLNRFVQKDTMFNNWKEGRPNEGLDKGDVSLLK